MRAGFYLPFFYLYDIIYVEVGMKHIVGDLMRQGHNSNGDYIIVQIDDFRHKIHWLAHDNNYAMFDNFILREDTLLSRSKLLRILYGV